MVLKKKLDAKISASLLEQNKDQYVKPEKSLPKAVAGVVSVELY